ncbi:hypothetical protein B0H10DRAFT_770730 [Mycena sp. CBHHK59/15]|nr:hypothetical protein B0H10DRAFT_770730 [Mycena sp. CBHHK59/15]
MEAAKERTEQGVMKWAFDDLEDDYPPAPPPKSTARGPPKCKLLDKLVIPCHSITVRTLKLGGFIASELVVGLSRVRAAMSCRTPERADICPRHSRI